MAEDESNHNSTWKSQKTLQYTTEQFKTLPKSTEDLHDQLASRQIEKAFLESILDHANTQLSLVSGSLTEASSKLGRRTQDQDKIKELEQAMLDKDNKHILTLKKNKQDAINAAWQKEGQDGVDLDIYSSEVDWQSANIISACRTDIQSLKEEITNLQTEDVLVRNRVNARTLHHHQLQASAKKHALAIKQNQRENSEELAKQRKTIQYGRNALEDALTKIEEQSAKIVSLKRELFESNLYSLDWQNKFNDLQKSAPCDIQAVKDEMTQNTVEPLNHEISDLKAQISDLRHATESQIQNAIDGVNTDKVEPLQHEITILTDDNSKLISGLESVRASIPKEISIAISDIQIKMVQPLQQEVLQSKQLQSKLTPALRDTKQSISGQTEDAERRVDIEKVQPLRRDIIKLKDTKIRLRSELEVPQHSIPGYVRQAVDKVETNKIKPLRRKIQALKTRKREFESRIQDLQNSIPQAIEEAADLVEMETIEPLRKEVLSLYTREKNLESQLLHYRISLPGTIRAAKEKLTETKPRPLREKCINLVNNNSLLETEIARFIRINRPDPDKMERAVARVETDQVMPLKECTQDLKTQCEDLEAQLQAREDSYRETIDALNKKICLQVDEILKSASQIHEDEVKFTRLEETIVSHEETITELKLTVANQEKTIAELHLAQEEGVDSQVTKILDIHRQQPDAQIAQIEKIAEPQKLVRTLAQDRYPFEPHKSRPARLSPEIHRWASPGPCRQQKLKLDESPPPSSSAVHPSVEVEYSVNENRSISGVPGSSLIRKYYTIQDTEPSLTPKRVRVATPTPDNSSLPASLSGVIRAPNETDDTTPKIDRLLTLTLLAWDTTMDDVFELRCWLGSVFSRGRTVETVRASIDKYIMTANKKNLYPPSCLAAYLANVKATSKEGEAAVVCKQCIRISVRFCFWAKFAPGITPNGNSVTKSIGSKDVRWILRKRKVNAGDPAIVPFTMGDVTV